MSALWSIIASWMYQYGSIYAGIPSSHGSYEAPVPEQLQKQAEPVGTVERPFRMVICNRCGKETCT